MRRAEDFKQSLSLPLGPVIGPMVMCGILIDKKDESKLVDSGVKDSKQLTPEKREGLVKHIKKIAKKVEVVILKPSDIDNALRTEGTNLNWLEADNMIKIINKLKPGIAYLDCPSNNITAFSNYLRTKLKAKTELHAEHKADEKYAAVAAASIIAKVTRDREIEKIKKEIGIDLGSGYPADPVTKKFLEENWNKYPNIFRKTWESYKAVVRGKKQKRLGEF